MFRDLLLYQLNLDSDDHVITHHWSVYLSPLIGFFIALFGMYLLRYILYRLTANDLLTLIAGILAIVLMIKTLVDFVNLYLDVMVFGEEGVTIYKRDSITDYRTEHFNRDKIETITHHQNSRNDKLYNKGDLKVLLEHGTTYRFTNVSKPSHHSAIFADRMHEYTHDDVSSEQSDEKFDILVDTLSEVIHEYMGDKVRAHKQPERPHRWKDEPDEEVRERF